MMALSNPHVTHTSIDALRNMAVTSSMPRNALSCLAHLSDSTKPGIKTLCLDVPGAS